MMTRVEFRSTVAYPEPIGRYPLGVKIRGRLTRRRFGESAASVSASAPLNNIPVPLTVRATVLDECAYTVVSDQMCSGMKSSGLPGSNAELVDWSSARYFGVTPKTLLFVQEYVPWKFSSPAFALACTSHP